jgi:hypothetical protein
MNLGAFVFGFFVVLAATLNFGFFVGDISDPSVHNEYELFAAVLISLVATALKYGDRTHLGAVHLATSLVADLQLIAATFVWVYASQISFEGLTAAATATVVSLSGGALLANLCFCISACDRNRHVPPFVARGQPEVERAGEWSRSGSRSRAS